MRKLYRQSLPAGVLAVLLAVPAWSAEKQPMAEETAPDQQAQQVEPRSESRVQQQAVPEREITTQQTTEHPLLSRKPEELKGLEVVDINGEAVGEIKDIVGSRSSQQIYAVVSVGGFMGLGDTEHLVPLEQLQLEGDKVHISKTEEGLAAGREYRQEGYVSLTPEDRPISEFSAFEEAEPEQEQAQPQTESNPEQTQQ